MHNNVPYLVGLLWSSDQLIAKTSTRTYNTHKKPRSMSLVGFEPINLRREAATDLCLRMCGH